MKKANRRIWIVSVIGLILCVVFAALSVKTTEEKISDFVIKNQSELNAIALAHLAGDNSIDTYKRVEVDGVYGTMVQFSYSAFGLSPASKYWGFYYSQDGTPAAFQGADLPLAQISEYEWKWSDGTDNGGITKRITDNWFYYEAWF